MSSNKEEKREEINCGKFIIIITNKKTKNIKRNHMSPYVSPLYERLKNNKRKIPKPQKLEFNDDSNM